MSDVELNVVQVAELTGIPSGAITKLCVAGKIEATSNPDTARKFWRIKLSTMDAVRSAYAEQQAADEAARNARASEIGRQSHSRMANAEKKIERLERIVAQLCQDLGSTACADPQGMLS